MGVTRQSGPKGALVTGEPSMGALLQPLSALRYCRSEMSTAKRARLNEIVSVDPDLMHGTPCFCGTRVPVRLLLDDLKSGFTIDQFLAGCPTVSRELVEGYLDSSSTPCRRKLPISKRLRF